MSNKDDDTAWVIEPSDETTPVSVHPLQSHICLKDTDPPPPDVPKFRHEPLALHGKHSSFAHRRAEPRVIVHPAVLHPLLDPTLTDTLLVARRQQVRKLGQVLVALVSALLAAAVVILIRILF